MDRFSVDEVSRHCTVDDAWVIAGGLVYDVSTFLDAHPGGITITREYLGKDISSVISTNQIHKHSDNALEILEHYRIGCIGSDREEMEKVAVKKYQENDPIDWSKPLLAQLHKLGDHYLPWVYKPVTFKHRLFQSEFVEMCSKGPWWMVPLVWIPFTCYMCYLALTGAPSYLPWVTTAPAVTLAKLLTLIPVGVLIWSLIEYLLHRFIFHLNLFMSSPAWITFHFILHGQHHKAPFDRDRLVFPVVPAGIIMLLIYTTGGFILPINIMRGSFAGGILGYIGYDMIHYYLHHGSPSKGSYFAALKAYHVAHHYINHHKGYGISSKLWDFVFSTVIESRDINSAD